MIAILSPAKQMQTVSRPDLTLTRPRYEAKTKYLAEHLRRYSPWQLETLMKVSTDLSFQAYDLIHSFDFDAPGTAALLAYHGLQYKNLAAEDFTAEDFIEANKRIRILSGLYGMVRPTDGVSPYRLEMQCRLPLDEGSLYRFWGDTLCRDLFADAQGQPVIDLASSEYSKAILPHLRPGNRVIQCQFVEARGGKLKTLATSAKMARGQMARWLVRNRIDDPEQLREFAWDGYHFAPTLSGADTLVFLMEP